MVVYENIFIALWIENSDFKKKFSWTTIIKLFTDQLEVSALPAGCMNQSKVSALTAGCMNQSEVSTLPAGCRINVI